jgi:hypothetical protein
MLAALKWLYRKLPLIHELRTLSGQIAGLSELEARRVRLAAEEFVRNLLVDPRYADPRHLIRFEQQVFSQNGEDGVVAEIFRRIGTTDQFFVEIAAGDGLENNTAFLLTQGWRGIWVEGDPANARKLQDAIAALKSGPVTIRTAFVNRENVRSLLTDAGVAPGFDYLSLDIDHNTYWVWEGMGDLRPRVVTVEYNSTWPPGIDWKVPYDPARTWDKSFGFGASLTALERLGTRLGYKLVGCEMSGGNAFFVREDLVGDHFVGPFDAATHYQPPRYFLVRDRGHPRGPRALVGG